MKVDMEIYKAEIKDGKFIKGELHSANSLKYLNIFDHVFIDDILNQFISRDNGLLFSNGKEIFRTIEVLDEKSKKILEESINICQDKECLVHHDIKLKIVAEKIAETTTDPIPLKVLVRDFKYD